jgi:hypothetical protein
LAKTVARKTKKIEHWSNLKVDAIPIANDSYVVINWNQEQTVGDQRASKGGISGQVQLASFSFS